MARIIGGIGTAHTPTIGFAHDRRSQDELMRCRRPHAFVDVAIDCRDTHVVARRAMWTEAR